MSSTVDNEPWPSNAEGYEIGNCIGKGAFAKVWQALCIPKQQEVAIKILELDNIDAGLEDITQEVHVMKLSQHPNVLPSYSAFVVNRDLWVVMPLMRKGSCLRVMNYMKRLGDSRQGFKEEHIATILKATLEGLQYLHSQNQVHRDVKAGNILMDSDGSVMISDFGVAGLLSQDADRKNNRKTFVGTPCWMAPEVMEVAKDGYDEKADIWSFGITALELAKGYAPYAKLQPMKVLLNTLKKPPPSLKSYEDYSATKNQFSRHFKEVVTLCLQKNPKLRPSASTLLSKPFFKKARPQKTLVKELLEFAPIPDTCESYNAAQVDDYQSENPGAAPLFAPGSSFAPGTTWTFDDEVQPSATEGVEPSSQVNSVIPGDTTTSASQQAGQNPAAAAAAAPPAAPKVPETHDDDFAAFEKQYAESMILNEEGNAE